MTVFGVGGFDVFEVFEVFEAVDGGCLFAVGGCSWRGEKGKKRTADGFLYMIRKERLRDARGLVGAGKVDKKYDATPSVRPRRNGRSSALGCCLPCNNQWKLQ